MYSVEITEKGIKQTLARLQPKLWSAARGTALRGSVGWLRGKVFDWIMSAGDGTWPDFHPLTKSFHHPYNQKGHPWYPRGRILGRSNWNWMTQFVDDWSSTSGLQGGIKFGGKGTYQKMSAIRAVQIEQGHKTPVTPGMRRLMGATKPKHSLFRKKPGEDYFPLRKTTTELVLPKRPIMTPVAEKNRQKLASVFEKIYFREIEK
jgi:hypothetical protein